MRRVIALTVAAGLPFAAAAAEQHRQLGAHEHGHGTLNIAVEGASVTLELTAPGDDIVGFEHDAVTPTDKTMVDKASAILGAPLAVFRVPASAGCTQTAARVELQAETHHDNDDDDHDHAAAGASKDAPADHASHEGHKEFHATYALTCAAPANLLTIDFAYFTAFERARRLTVNVIAAKGQSSFEVSRETPHLDLGGLV